MRYRVGVFATALSLASLAAVAQAPKPDPARAYIEKQATAFSEAFAKGDFKTLANMYTEDAILMPPDGEMVKGRPAIEAFWKGAQQSGLTGAQLTVVEVTSSGDQATEVGTAVLTLKPANQPEAKQNGKYLVMWKRQPDGTWKLHRDIWNGSPTAAR
jgi:uncharacterized protein (TIGR02246 family)